MRLGQVVRGDLERSVLVQGRVVAAFHPRLFSPAEGIATLSVLPGEEVLEGQLLVRVESPELKNELQQGQSRLVSFKSELSRQEIMARRTNLENQQEVDLLQLKLEAAQRELVRAETLHRDGLLNKSDFEKAQDDVQVARLEVKHTREKAVLEKDSLRFELEERQLQVQRQELVVEELQRKVDRLLVAAPFDGMVATVEIQDKDAVSLNQPLLSVVDLSRFEVEIRVPENYADDVLPGTPGIVLYDSREYAGQVTSLSPEVNQNQVEGRLAFGDETPAGLKQNQRVSIRLVLESRPDVLKVPRGPYLESGGGRSVYVLQDGLATLREIAVGASSISEVEVLHGLEEGEQILLTEVTRFDGAKTVLIRD